MNKHDNFIYKQTNRTTGATFLRRITVYSFRGQGIHPGYICAIIEFILKQT